MRAPWSSCAAAWESFFLYFIGAIVLGFLACWFLRLPGKGSRRMGLSLAAAYVVFEVFASAVYQGRLPGLWAVILGIACLGMGLGALVRWLFLGLWRRRGANRAL